MFFLKKMKLKRLYILIKPRFIYLTVFIVIILTHLFKVFNWTEKSSIKVFFKPSRRGVLSINETEENCGIKQTCPSNSFPIFLSTGQTPNILPRLCVSGKYVIKPATKDRNRGFNAAVIEPNYFEAVSVKHFDTYVYNYTVEIANWIYEIPYDYIIVIFTYDEASFKLTYETKGLFNSIGSGKIQNLFYRSQWFMITQKVSPGFTIYEKLSYSKKKKWGDMIEFRGCIPKTIPKRKTTLDEPIRQNRRKLQFCQGKKDEKYKGFCTESRFEIIMPALLTNKSFVGNPVYFLPIFLFASKNLEIFIASLDSLIHQPGITPSYINILYETSNSLSLNDITSLCKIYGVKSYKTKFANTFKSKIEQIKKLTNVTFPQKQHAIIIDSDVILSPDFLFFMAQIFPIMQKDKEISIISGWSSNCYVHEGNAHVVHRIRGVPKYGALISTKHQISYFQDIFAPDVARLQGPEACHIPSLESNNWIERPQDLLKYPYFHKMVILQQLSQVIEIDEILSSCSSSTIKSKTNVIYVKKDLVFRQLLSCLGIRKNQYGMYEGIVRLFVNGKTFLVITNKSSFYKSRPLPSNSNRDYNCRLKLQKHDDRTSTQIGLQYSPEKTIMFEKNTFELPKLRLPRSYLSGKIYTPKNYYITTYNEKFPPILENPNVLPSKLLKQEREYSRFGKDVRPITIYKTEYKEEYKDKVFPDNIEGFSIEKLTSCPMITTGRDEREALPLSQNFNKYLDIYISTTRMDHRPFTLQEQKTIAMKDAITAQETMEIPKGRGFGRKFPVYLEKDLDKRDRIMYDALDFPTEPKQRFFRKVMPKVPHFGSESETQSAYKKPEGCTMPFISARFAEFPTVISGSSATQNLCPPGMYTTESYAIDNHTSPQTVV